MKHLSEINTAHMPMMVTIQGVISPECWHNMTPSEQAEYIHVLVRAMDNAEGQPHLGGLGATILNMDTATAYNGRSAQGQESAKPWELDPFSEYSSPTDQALARDLYCFQHFAEKLLDIAGEANSASDICEPSKQTPQLYNRDGMLGVRTQSILENYASTDGKKLGPNTEIPQFSPIRELADKLIRNLEWTDLTNAEFASFETEATVPPPSPASDVDPAFVEYYKEKGLPELVGLPPLKDNGGKTDDTKREEDFEGDTSQSNKTPLLLIGGGVAMLALALYLNRDSE